VGGAKERNFMAIMPRRFFELGLLAAVAMLPAGAQEVNHSWEKLAKTTEPGTKIIATTMDGKNFEGRLFSVTSDSISVEVGSAMRYSTTNKTLSLRDVFRVRTAGTRRRHVYIGMSIGGAVVGILAGSAAYMVSGKTGAAYGAAGGAGLGMELGAVIGAALPRSIGPTLFEATSESRTVWLKDHASPQIPAAASATTRP
jgi:hypothetical protein